jgi:PAS domain S-box-containing protein
MNKLLERIILGRYVASQDTQQKFRVIIINTVCLSLMAVSFCLALVYLRLGVDNLAVYNFICSCASMIPPILIRLKYFTWAVFCFFFLMLITCLFFGYVIPTDTHMQYGLMFPIMLSFILFSNKQKGIRYSIIFISFLGFILLETKSISPDAAVYPGSLLLFVRIVTGIGLIILLASVLSVFMKVIEEKSRDLAKANSQFNQLVSQLTDVIWSTNPDGSDFRDLSGSFERKFGFTEAEMNHDPDLWMRIVHPEDKKIAEKSALELTNSGNSVSEYRIIGRDGKTSWINDRKSVLYDEADKPVKMGGVATDITERKIMEEKLRTKNEELEKINAEKDKFFSILAHDLRHPFNSLLGFTEMLMDDMPHLTQNQIYQVARSLRNSATSLFQLIENLLEWSRIQCKTIEFSPRALSLKSEILNNMSVIQDMVDKKCIGINYDDLDDLTIIADEYMFGAIVRNLVTNAVKFSYPGSEIRISCKPAGEERVVVSIADSGIGMDEEMVRDLFRLDANISRRGTCDEPSTGLGLQICKEFVGKHGGKIWAESRQGGGSTFHFTLSLKVIVPD